MQPDPAVHDLFDHADVAPGADAPDRRLPIDRAADADALADALLRRHRDRIVAEHVLPARAARHAPFPDALDARLVAALRARGVTQLYSHQRETWDHVAAGRNVVVVTPTASGKSLCYTVPVLQSALQDGAKALFLFPTKALAQDQVASLIALDAAGSLGLRAMTFDGDTPGDARRAVRTHADIVVTNPDMLHQAVLPHHTKWAQCLRQLRWIVIDELHTYRGVFGAHVANVLRRLARICAFHGATPQFVLCSATIANPQELAERLIGAPVTPVTESGAPQGRRRVLIWNPPLVNPGLGLRASAKSQAARLARTAVRRGLRTIVFCNARTEVEVVTRYLKDVFDRDPRQPARIAAYRGGYLPTERRAREQALRDGRTACVVSTSALELGVDIGHLDVCVLDGWPGSVAAALQRFGRAGRRNRSALGVLVCSSQLIDQYVAREPGFFLGAPVEHARIDPDQLLILMDHVRCAAFELPFEAGDRFGGAAVDEALDYLAQSGVVHREGTRWHWVTDSYPANAVSLRAIADGNFTVIDMTHGSGRIIAEVDQSAAAVTLYEGAIHLVQAQPWQIERLDWVGRKAFARRTDVDWWTDAVDYTRLKVLDTFETADVARGRAAHGEVHVVRRVAGYKKIRYYTHENVGWGPVSLPDQELHTTAVWWQADPHALAAVLPDRAEAIEGFLGAAHALHHVAALTSLAEPRDLGRAVGDAAGTWSAVADPTDPGGRARLRALDGAPVALDGARTPFVPTLWLYDQYPGGIGMSAPLFDRRADLLARAHAVIAGCACTHGCPACIGPVLPPLPRQRFDARRAALAVLVLLGADAAPPLAPVMAPAAAAP
ncbi:MAG: DEAD/DEAH box helicase [Burkholderiales bacterium]|jgi:DEAD/DEAH box helicase domain-containing protein|nr:DEAD/DEAH box helicase [Burkholderiales bacterium]